MTSVSVAPLTMPRGIGAADELSSGYKIVLTLLFALAAHLFVIFGVSFEMPKPPPSTSVATIDVIVVNQKGPVAAAPEDEGTVRQNTVGETVALTAPAEPVTEVVVEPRVAAMEPTRLAERAAPAAALPDPFVFTEAKTPAEAAQPLTAPVPRVQQEEQTDLVEDPTPEPVEPPPAEPPQPRKITAAQILASRDLEIANLSVRLAPGSNAYGARIRRKAINAGTREFKYSTYLDAWRKKVERIGNLNYPQEAKRKGMFGNLILHVALRSDGSIETLRIVRSSGHALLDEAAMDIVRLAAPYAPFPEDIKSETDVLDITRTWQFLRGNRFSW